jgi:hypothetical protein
VARFARRRVLCISAAAVLPVAIRLLMLPWLPPPEPRVPDEFSHLLVADTLAKGRLANPPHALWPHLETAYVLQQPNYASIYPIGQGSVLAAGEILTGHPWAGVLSSVALMSGAICWMLFGYLPAPWAALGGLLGAIHLGLARPWMDSYWGGAFGAFGGALVFGALWRLRHAPTMGRGAVLGAGWSIAWLTRPFESVLLLLVIWLTLAALVVSAPRPMRRRWLTPVLTLMAVHVLAGAITLQHNRAVTGSVATLPYQLSQRLYGTPQGFLWQAPIAVPVLRVPELHELAVWQAKQKEDLDEHPLRQQRRVLAEAWTFYVGPWFSLPLAMLLFAARDPIAVLGGGLIVGALLVSGVYPFFYPHYVAAYACVIVLLIVRGMMALSSFRIRRMPVGGLAVLFVVLGGVLTALPIDAGGRAVGAATTAAEAGSPRHQVSSRLAMRGGTHVVFVRYGPRQSFHDEWIYNGADVDAATLVWCRSLGAREDVSAIRYYRDRYAWLATIDGNDVELIPYEPDLTAALSP